MKKRYNLIDLRHGIDDIDDVKVIDISNNNLTQKEFDKLKLEQYKNLEHLYCQENKIEKLGEYNNLIGLRCFRNPIKNFKFANYPKLDIHDCEF